MAVNANVTLRIETEEFSNASKVILADKSSGVGWTSGLRATTSSIVLSIVSNTAMNGATLNLKPSIETLVTAGLQLAPSAFTIGGKSVTLTTFPDGYYEFHLDIVWADTTTSSYSDNQGFISFLENAAQRVQLDMVGSALDRFVNIHIYAYGAKAAGSVGKVEQFQSLVDTINSYVSNASMSYS